MGNLRRRPSDVPIVSIRANPNNLARLLLAPPKVLPPAPLHLGLAGARNSRYRRRGRFFLLVVASLAERTLLPLTAPDLSVSAGDTASPLTQRSSSLVQAVWSPTFVFAAACPFLPPVVNRQSLVALSRTSDTATQIASRLSRRPRQFHREHASSFLSIRNGTAGSSRSLNLACLSAESLSSANHPSFASPASGDPFSLPSVALSLRKEFPERLSTVDSSSLESGPLWELDLALLRHYGALLGPLRRLALCGCSYFPVLH